MPKPRQPTRKPRKNLISFLDLGSGPEAEHGWRLAEHRKGRPNKGMFVSVDLERLALLDKRGRLLSQPHHQFKQVDATEFLKKQRPNSVKIINDEFFIDDVLAESLLKTKKLISPERVAALRSIFTQYVGSVFRVLMPNGRLFVTVLGLNKNILRDALKKGGFEILSEKNLTKETALKGASKTTIQELRDLERLPEFLKRPLSTFHGSYEAFGFERDISTDVWGIPCRISARKPVSRKK
ncbi:MAG: hypothetical protein HY392_05145 [Candidatus Diapherotrites archaeon]|nr:hypothetical protein [Candidatus Diapherotrites archaeon]